MRLGDLTDPSAVFTAIAEYDRLGSDFFLARYGFNPARSYFLVHDGKRYDSKAIAAAAVGFQFPADGPLTANEFSGGEATVRRKLESLGFRVEVLDNRPNTNPHWIREETVLALDLYARRRPQLPGEDDPEIIQLSHLLQRYAAQRGVTGNASFRNPNGVSMKVANLSRLDQEDARRGLGHGSTTVEPQVWAEFMPDTAKLHAAAEAIRRQIKAGDSPEGPRLPFPDGDGETGDNGAGVSRGPKPSFGAHVHTTVDGDAQVYIMRLTGAVLNLFPRRSLNNKVVIKVGRTNDLKRRQEELNGGFPPGLDLQWRATHSQVFPSGDEAHGVEQALLRELDRRGDAIGREFAIVEERHLDSLLVDAMMLASK